MKITTLPFYLPKHYYRSHITVSHNLPQYEMLKRLHYGEIMERYDNNVKESIRLWYNNRPSEGETQIVRLSNEY